MKIESRTEKSIINAHVGAVCYFLSLIVSFFSRKIFLDHLGAEFLGYTGSIGGILGILNIAELGIGSAISIVLYKPLFDKNQDKITEIVSVLGYLYRKVGYFIVGAGVVFSVFLPWIFPSVKLSWTVVYLGFYAYLFCTFIGYYANYTTVLLSADQRNYIVSGYNQFVISFKVIVQLILAIFTHSFILYLILEIVFGIIYSFILHYRVRNAYPWLHSSAIEGKHLLKKYSEIKTKLRQLFVHRIGGFIQFQSTPLFVYAFVSLPMVAIYGNYMLVAGSVRTLIYHVLDGTSASVGNLVAEGDREKIYSIYKELLSLRILVAGIISCCVYLLIGDFISLWVGEEYVLSNKVALLIAINLFLVITRDATDQFITAFGLVHDVYSPVIESLLFVALSLLLGNYFGLEGLLLAPILTLLLVIYSWKPYLLFSQGFIMPIKKYLVPFVHYLIMMAIPVVALSLLMNNYGIACKTWLLWILKSLLSFIALTSTLVLLFYTFSSNFRCLAKRITGNTFLFKSGCK